MKKKALIVWGGWDGHEPEQVSAIFKSTLENENFEVEVKDSLEVLADQEKINQLHLFVPVWTMGEISREQATSVIEAVANGTGIAGCHGGMCDAFRTSTEWQFMTGGNWVSHPGGDGVEYMVNIRSNSSELVAGIKDFKVKSEHYYLHVDPAVEVLATTRFPLPDITWYHSSNPVVDMPVAWTKYWGLGRVYYNSLGHHADIFNSPEVLEMMRRGFLWCAKGKDNALENGLTSDIFKSDKKMF